MATYPSRDRISLAAGFLSDVHNPTAPIALQKIYRGASSDADARRLAHQFADDIIGRLSGGLAGISQTQIAFVSNKSGTKEVWAMDYDGANQHQLTHLKSIALTPRWSPDADPHRIHLLRSLPRHHLAADLPFLHRLRPDDFLPAFSRNKQLARMVA